MPVTTYLDHNATTPVRPEVVDVVTRVLARCGNPSSVHGFGRAAREVVERARDQVARLAGARPQEIVFTSGGSEANALALRGAGRGRVLVSAIEHVSALEAVADPELVPATPEGTVDLTALAAMLAASDRPAVVSVMLANNETGVLQPLPEVVAIARRFGALVHTDAVQAAGKIPVDFQALGVDLLSLSAHKLGGPQGVGALAVAERVALAPQQRGGGQERGRRAGTENVPGIAGFGAAAEAALEELAGQSRIAALRDRLEREIARAVPDARIFGARAPRLPNTCCVAMPGVASEVQVMALDLAGVAVSAGSACSSGKVTPSHVLRAMGGSEDGAATAIRVSLGRDSGAADVDRFIEAWRELWLRKGAGRTAAA